MNYASLYQMAFQVQSLETQKVVSFRSKHYLVNKILTVPRKADRCKATIAVSTLNSENIVTHWTHCSQLLFRINHPVAINDELDLKDNNEDYGVGEDDSQYLCLQQLTS